MKPALEMALAFAAGAIVATAAGTALRSREEQRAIQPAPSGDLSATPRRDGQSPPRRESQSPKGRDGERAQVVNLQARVREFERRAAASDATPDRDPQRAKFHDFTDAELQAMAQNCEVRFDLPRIRREPFQLSPDLGARQHLSEAEQAKVAAAVDAVSKDVVAHLRSFYLEATGDAAGADTLDPESLMREVLEKSPPAVLQAARTEIARERAGMPPAPSGTIAERYLRYITTVGDSLQSSDALRRTRRA